jgi:hypothetical protein
MDRKLITEIIGIPTSSLSDWYKKDSNNWRKKIMTILINIEESEVRRLLQMGDIANMTFEELEENISLYLEVKEEK